MSVLTGGRKLEAPIEKAINSYKKNGEVYREEGTHLSCDCMAVTKHTSKETEAFWSLISFWGRQEMCMKVARLLNEWRIPPAVVDKLLENCLFSAVNTDTKEMNIIAVRQETQAGEHSSFALGINCSILETDFNKKLNRLTISSISMKLLFH